MTTMNGTTQKTRPHRRDMNRGRPREQPHFVVPPEGAPETHLGDLQSRSAQDLIQLAREQGLTETAALNRPQLVVEIARARSNQGHRLRAEGTLEVLPDGFGFLRLAEGNYLSSPHDVYVSPTQVRGLGLKTGMVVGGTVRPP